MNTNYHQNNDYYFQKRNHTQEKIDYTEQELTGSSSTNIIYQNTSSKIKLPKDLENPTLFRKSKMERFLNTRP